VLGELYGCSVLIFFCIEMARASDIFPQAENPSMKAKEVRQWLATKGVRDFEPVSLFCDQLKKVRVGLV
jgi:hypothetical protein